MPPWRWPPSGVVPSSADPGTFPLGDRSVRRLGFGTMRLTGTLPFHRREPRDRGTSIAVLRRAVELGVDHVDTAAFYFSRLRAELVDQGLVGHVRVSATTLDQLEAARAVTEIVCLQSRLALGSRDGDLPVLRRCGDLGIAFVPFFTVSGAGQQGRPGPEPEAFLAIPGTGCVAHLEENVAAASLRLTEDQLVRLARS
jgi:aryl-alcohol dehydrogenase-like predicted oxidoreductase